MDLTGQLRAWGVAHAQARHAERAAQHSGDIESSSELQRKAKSLRERADRLHREIYDKLGQRE